MLLFKISTLDVLIFLWKVSLYRGEYFMIKVEGGISEKWKLLLEESWKHAIEKLDRCNCL